MPSPADLGFHMPAEWAPHSRCWMAWPCREALWGEGLEAARDATADVAKAIAGFEPVTMVANPESLAEVSLRFSAGVSCLPMALDDSWLRDTGPSFLVDGRGGLSGIAWRFNGWGERYQPYDKDAVLAAAVLDHLEVERIDAPLILEGGSIHVDGEGTLITTEECLLNPNRNANLWREEIERLLASHLGIRKVIWLARGLVDDETDGHVDNLVSFVKPGVVLALTAGDPEDANHERLADNLERLRNTTDAQGRQLEVIEVEQPNPRLGDDGRRLALSYVNLYLANGGVVMPSFEDPADQKAYETVAQCFPERKVVQVPALDIVVGGGGIHCITQQQPQP